MTDLNGLDVKCPQCKCVFFKTTERFDPRVKPNGGMVTPLVKYQIDWLCSSSTPASEMTCPECLGQLAHAGGLLVMVPLDRVAEVYRMLFLEDTAEETQQEESSEKKHICPVCGKEAKTELGLNSHMRSHKKEGERA